MRRLLFTEAARADLAETVDWYDAHAAHMVRQLREALQAAIARIAATRSSSVPGPIILVGLCFSAFPTP